MRTATRRQAEPPTRLPRATQVPPLDMGKRDWMLTRLDVALQIFAGSNRRPGDGFTPEDSVERAEALMTAAGIRLDAGAA